MRRKMKIISGVGRPGHGFELVQRPDGTRYVIYRVGDIEGTADIPGELGAGARDILGEYFYSNYPEFSQWWSQ